MLGFENPIEKLVQTIIFKGVKFEMIERPEVIWVGCVDYADNNTDESDIGATLKRYREELINVSKQELINPDCSAALSFHYNCTDKPCGIMFAQETYSDKQDERYDLYKMPASLFVRMQQSTEAEKLLGREIQGVWELFGIIKEQMMPEYGYKFNDAVPEIEYYNNKNGTGYAYVPIVKERTLE